MLGGAATDPHFLPSFPAMLDRLFGEHGGGGGAPPGVASNWAGQCDFCSWENTEDAAGGRLPRSGPEEKRIQAACKLR